MATINIKDMREFGLSEDSVVPSNSVNRGGYLSAVVDEIETQVCDTGALETVSERADPFLKISNSIPISNHALNVIHRFLPSAQESLVTTIFRCEYRGYSEDQMSEVTGISVDMLQAISQDSDYNTVKKAWNKILSARTKEATTNILQSATPYAAQTIQKMVHSKDERIQFLASKDVLDRTGYGSGNFMKPVIPMNIVGLDSERLFRLASPVAVNE